MNTVLTTNPAQGRADSRRQIASHPIRKGSKIQSVGFTRAVKPHNNPYPDQCSEDVDSRNSKVAQTISASISAAKLWSHVHSSGISTAYGRKTHNHADERPTFSPKIRFPIAWMGQQVAAEN